MNDLAAQVRELLAQRDRARRYQLFRPDRGIMADDVFVAAVVKLAEAHAPAPAPAPRKPPARRPRAVGKPSS